MTDRERELLEAILKAIGWLGAEEISRDEIREYLRSVLNER
jgi:hypothetical protein